MLSCKRIQCAHCTRTDAHRDVQLLDVHQQVVVDHVMQNLPHGGATALEPQQVKSVVVQRLHHVVDRALAVRVTREVGRIVSRDGRRDDVRVVRQLK